jgi:hypothetical protein
MCKCLREGRDVPFGQVFHTSSLTRPTVVSGSNAIDLRRPDTSRNCTSVCGTCGTSTAPVSTSCLSSSSGCARASAPPLPPPLPSSRTAATAAAATSSSRQLLSPAALPGRVLSTRVNEVRVLAGRAAISPGMDRAIVGRELLECMGLRGGWCVSSMVAGRNGVCVCAW